MLAKNKFLIGDIKDTVTLIKLSKFSIKVEVNVLTCMYITHFDFASCCMCIGLSVNKKSVFDILSVFEVQVIC